MLILIMDGISKEIFDNEQLIDANFALYREKAKALGLLALAHRERLNILIGNSLLTELINAKQSYDSISALSAKREALEASIKEEKKTASDSKNQVTELERQKKELLSRLGAVALVQAQSGVASAAIAELLKAELEAEREAIAQSNSNSAFEMLKGRYKLNKLQKNQAKRVYDIGVEIEKNGLSSQVKGENGNGFALLLEKLNEELAFHKGTVEHLTRNLEKKADEQLNTINDKEQLEEAELKLNETAISYGIYLYENGSKWISAETPEEELDLLTEMLSLQNEREKIEQRIRQCYKEISIDELSLVISNDKKTIERLLVEKKQIEDEIERLNGHISQVTAQIMEVKSHE